jgi:SH3-like domain-containing protein
MEEILNGLLAQEEKAIDEYTLLLSKASKRTERELLERVLAQKKFECESLRLLAGGKVPDRFIAFGNISENEVNFRGPPNPKSEIIAELSKGTPVILMEHRGNWAGIQLYDGRQGWVFKDYVMTTL